MARRKTRGLDAPELEDVTEPQTQEGEHTMSDETTETVSETPPAAESKRPKKLAKDLSSEPGKVIITVLGGVKGKMTFDTALLPEQIRENLVPFGLGHKLGDSAAGCAGVEAEESINKVWEGLLAGDWTVRGPAQAKVSIADVTTNFQNLNEEEKAEAAKLMRALGIKLPGITD